MICLCIFSFNIHILNSDYCALLVSFPCKLNAIVLSQPVISRRGDRAQLSHTEYISSPPVI